LASGHTKTVRVPLDQEEEKTRRHHGFEYGHGDHKGRWRRYREGHLSDAAAPFDEDEDREDLLQTAPPKKIAIVIWRASVNTILSNLKRRFQVLMKVEFENSVRDDF
jgi:hypothetical protein